MHKKVVAVLFFALVNIICAESKNVFSSFLSYLNSKINYKNEISKVIQMGNTLACIVDNENSYYNECSCTFKKLTNFEKKCSSNFKKNQEEAKKCSEGRCEICCNLVNSKNTSNSILDYELFCKKKCNKSNIILDLSQEDYKLAFKKLIEFIRIFFPSNVLNVYPIQKRSSPNYTNKQLQTKYQKIKEDLNEEAKMTNMENMDGINSLTVDGSEELFSPYDEY
ncbi:secreted ookinete protein, putative [Plasmodium malariae]|uniref:Secreted ookinete protein, putative n=1 Tax=Plasmodium malariae TaxID=5858 RepID=A0A1C3L2H2_PLAMA|nr:secreted ookinete protein, putative [Plasmodium malariae]